MTTSTVGGRRGSPDEAARATRRRALATGRFRDHDALPSERDLADGLAVSRTTLRRVLATLSEDRVLAQRPAGGTVVNRAPRVETPTPSEPFRLAGFADDMRRRGYEPSSREIERGLVRPTAQDALVLGCSPETPVFRLCRLRYADGLPMALERAVAPSALLGEGSAVGRSLRATLERQGFGAVRSLDRVQAVLMSDGEAARLRQGQPRPAGFAGRLPRGRTMLPLLALAVPRRSLRHPVGTEHEDVVAPECQLIAT